MGRERPEELRQIVNSDADICIELACHPFLEVSGTFEACGIDVNIRLNAENCSFLELQSYGFVTGNLSVWKQAFREWMVLVDYLQSRSGLPIGHNLFRIRTRPCLPIRLPKFE